jgi:hypothetical protein
MPLFARRKTLEEEMPAPRTPTNLVIQMRQQNLSDNQIVQALQKEGYTSAQIFDALSQADIRKTIQPAPEEAYPEMPPEIPQQQFAPQQQMQMPQQPAGVSRDQVEEVAEAIIDEKWGDFEKGISKIISWKDSAEERLIKIEQNIEDIKKRIAELNTAILGKISDYDAGIRNVGTEIKAMQEVFKKVLPEFTENVAELSRITKQSKKK